MSIHCSEVAAKTIHPSIPKRLIKTQECFAVLCLNAANNPIGKAKIVAIGTVNQVEVHPRDIFRYAIKKNAVSIIIAHNHPSKDLTASTDDLAITARTKQAGELLGITLLDHIILSPDGKFNSLADKGLL